MLRPAALLLASAPLAAAAVGLTAGCEEPYYDDNIGVEGVATEPGSLAGTFALKSQALDQADAPILGKVDAGGITYGLVVRTWREDDPGFYDERIKVCDVENFEVAGLTTTNTRATIESIPDSDAVLEVNHPSGEFVRHTYREFWAVRDLPDDEDFPTNKESRFFYDMDEDGNPGTTLNASGLVTGDVYVAQRKTIDQTGVVQGEDVCFGLARVKKEGIVIGATNDLLLAESERVPHPDPKQSWWMEIRLDDDDGCDAVIDAVQSDALPRRRPF